MDWTRRFSQLTDQAASILGKPLAFLSTLVCTAIWLVLGPLTGWSDTWQLVANTTTNVVTFLMVFVIQNSENRDSSAIQAKLDEVLRAVAPRVDESTRVRGIGEGSSH